MDRGLLGKKVVVVNPSEENRWLRSMTGVIVKVDEEDFCYVVEFKISAASPFRVRMVRGEFEEIPEK